MLARLQHRAVDSIKRHALTLALGSRRAETRVLTEYLWIEEGAEASALHDALRPGVPGWVGKLVTRHLADERRHAELLRVRLAALGKTSVRPPPALAHAKIWWLERACAPYLDAFEAGPIVVLLAVAAQLETTGVRMFVRHLAVLEDHEQATGVRDETAALIRAILSDERRHAKSCAAAARRLVRDGEHATFETMRARIAEIDRAFGVTTAAAFWVLVAAAALRDRVQPGSPRRAAEPPQLAPAAEPLDEPSRSATLRSRWTVLRQGAA